MKKRLSREEGLKLLKEYGTPEHVVRHCIAVTDTAAAIGKALNKAGYHLDIELIQGAAIIHDIARVEDKHWEVGADIAKNLGRRRRGRYNQSAYVLSGVFADR